VNDQEYTYIKKTIKRLIGIDLDNYKTPQMQRRLGGLASSNADSIALYCKLVERDEDARTQLRNFLTINVSEFFRDAQQFDQLKKRVLPMLLEKRQQLSVWSAGCSHGGEPYSIAMLLEELAPNRKHRILATDIDQEILARAKNGGPYSPSDVSNVEPKLLLKYFNREKDGYHLIDNVKRKVEFRRHNLLADLFQKNFDLIICRNVVIYFTEEAKGKLYKGFSHALNENGILFIGATESLLDLQFLNLERMFNCFYMRRAATTAQTSSERRTARLQS